MWPLANACEPEQGASRHTAAIKDRVGIPWTLWKRSRIAREIFTSGKISISASAHGPQQENDGGYSASL